MTAHDAPTTPGPAKGPYTTDTVIYEGSRAYNIEVYDRDEFLIAEVFGRSVAAAEATARLLASAWGLAEENARLRSALMFIKNLTPEPIGAGFVTGPQALLDAAQREARAALARKEPADV